MSDPTEVVTSILVLAVSFVVVAMIWGTFQGWDVTAISSLVSSLAVPFVIALIGIFALLQIAELT